MSWPVPSKPIDFYVSSSSEFDWVRFGWFAEKTIFKPCTMQIDVSRGHERRCRSSYIAFQKWPYTNHHRVMMPTNSTYVQMLLQISSCRHNHFLWHRIFSCCFRLRHCTCWSFIRTRRHCRRFTIQSLFTVPSVFIAFSIYLVICFEFFVWSIGRKIPNCNLYEFKTSRTVLLKRCIFSYGRRHQNNFG